MKKTIAIFVLCVFPALLNASDIIVSKVDDEHHPMREKYFSGWIPAEKYQAYFKDTFKNYYPIFVECDENGRRRLIWIERPKGIKVGVKTFRTYDKLLKSHDKKTSKGQVLLSVHVTNNQRYSAVWVSKNYYKGALKKLKQFGITKAEINLRDALAYLNRGISWHKKGDYDRAIADYNKALEIDSRYAMAYKNRGWAWNEKGNYDRAIADYNKALEIDPRFAMAYNNRGWTWTEKGNYDRAIADLNKALEIKPRFAMAYNNRGIAYKNKGDYDRAIDDFNKALEIKPRYAFAYNNLGWTWTEKGNYDRAIADLNKALEIKPRFAMAYNNRGLAYLKKGDYDRAIADLNKALKIHPRFAMAYSNRGRAYLKKGDYDRACSDFKKACELGSCKKLNEAMKKEYCDAFLPWMSADELQKVFDRLVKRKFYSKQIEGREYMGKAQYRAIFVEFPPGQFYFFSHYGLSKAEYDKKNKEYLSKGYNQTYHQKFINSLGQTMHQGTWVKQ